MTVTINPHYPALSHIRLVEPPLPGRRLSKITWLASTGQLSPTPSDPTGASVGVGLYLDSLLLGHSNYKDTETGGRLLVQPRFTNPTD